MIHLALIVMVFDSAFIIIRSFFNPYHHDEFHFSVYHDESKWRTGRYLEATTIHLEYIPFTAFRSKRSYEMRFSKLDDRK